MDSRDPKHLHPKLRPLAASFIERAAAAGISVVLTSTYRSAARQDELYAQGRTRPGKIVTNVCGGQSRHNGTLAGQPASTAFDCVPVKAGKAIWDDERAWQALGKIGRELGLEWGGDWPRFRDKPHFQLRAGTY